MENFESLKGLFDFLDKEDDLNSIFETEKVEDIEEMDKSEDIEEMDKSEDIEEMDKSEDIEEMDKSEDIEEIDKSEDIEEIDKSNEGTEDDEDIDALFNEMFSENKNSNKNKKSSQKKPKEEVIYQHKMNKEIPIYLLFKDEDNEIGRIPMECLIPNADYPAFIRKEIINNVKESKDKNFMLTQLSDCWVLQPKPDLVHSKFQRQG